MELDRFAHMHSEAFMDYVLKGRKSELFDGPSKNIPEIIVG